MHPSCLPSFQELNNMLLSCLYQCLSTREKFKASLERIHTKPEQLLQIIWDYTNGNFNPVECFQYTIPNKNHYLLAELINQGINCIVTPNFDPCLEKVLEKRHIDFEFFDKIQSESKEAEDLIQSIKGKKVTIWKPHGGCREMQTLCYTRTKVAKLCNSQYLREIFSYIIQNYNMLFLGYSGYDDDFSLSYMKIFQILKGRLYGMLALEFGKKSQCMQSIARTYTYLAIADAKHGKRETAIQKFRKSYEIHKQIGEGLGYFYTALEECEIDISQIH